MSVVLRFIDEERPGLIGANEARILGYYLGVEHSFDPSYWSVIVFQGRAMRPPPDHYRLYENRLLYHCEKKEYLRKKWQLVFPRQVSYDVYFFLIKKRLLPLLYVAPLLCYPKTQKPSHPL